MTLGQWPSRDRPDGRLRDLTVPAFWLKAFPQATILRDKMWEVVDGDREIPEWLVCGETVLLPKENCEGRPDQYRPIVLLNNTYKLLTGALAEVLADHVTR